MVDDEYTLLTSKEVSELKQDVDYLKKNPLGGMKSGKNLQESIDKLNENIQTLIEIFKESSEMMKAEERESEVIIKRIQPIERQLAELSDQNQKIAKGILAVADMVSEREEKPRMMERPMPQMQRPMPSMQPPSMPRPMPMPQMQIPMPQMQQSQPTMQNPGMMPPPPQPKKEEKKGFFGGLSK